MKYIQSVLRAAALSAAPVLLTGCTFGSSIDNLMAPPKLSAQQEQIYGALTEATGQNISLKYPKSGKYLSAFIVEDIDGDGVDEAVVFYERNGLGVDEITLRINVLDQDDGNWRSVCDTAAAGAEIEKVMISKLGDNERVNLIIGSSLINRSEKNVTVYNYDQTEGNIAPTFFSESYSFMDVTDLDGDEKNEFLLLTGSANGAPAGAEVYQLDEEGKAVEMSFSEKHLNDKMMIGLTGEGKIFFISEFETGAGEFFGMYDTNGKRLDVDSNPCRVGPSVEEDEMDDGGDDGKEGDDFLPEEDD